MHVTHSKQPIQCLVPGGTKRHLAGPWAPTVCLNPKMSRVSEGAFVWEGVQLHFWSGIWKADSGLESTVSYSSFLVTIGVSCLALEIFVCDIQTDRRTATTITIAALPHCSGPPSISGQPHNNWWWFHDIGYPLLDAELSLCTAPWSGTPCQMTSTHGRTMSPLDRAWKPGYFPDTSVLSALETLW